MKPSGTRGTYCEVYVGYRLERIVCSSCDLLREAGPSGLAYELWNKAKFKGNTLWAANETQLRALIDWLASNRSALNTGFETLPKWIITDRTKVIAKLRKLLAK